MGPLSWLLMLFWCLQMAVIVMWGRSRGVTGWLKSAMDCAVRGLLIIFCAAGVYFVVGHEGQLFGFGPVVLSLVVGSMAGWLILMDDEDETNGAPAWSAPKVSGAANRGVTLMTTTEGEQHARAQDQQA